jgi:hypothetical protein
VRVTAAKHRDSRLPTIARWRGYRFSFYSREPDEPPHVHVVKGSGQAKFWLGDCSLAKTVGFADHELTRIGQKVRRDRNLFLRAWNDFFGSG